MTNSFDTYFRFVSKVRMISISGGEPLLFKELPELIEHLLRYES
jgi:organic radical activating enzyme